MSRQRFAAFLVVSAAVAMHWLFACDMGTGREEKAVPVGTGQKNDAEQPLTTIEGASVPRPGALVAVDYERREINSSIVIVGSGAGQFLEHVHRTTAASDGGGKQFIDAAVPGEASFFYLPVQLGEIRGFKTRFHLYGFRSDARLVPMLEDFVPHASGIIVAQRDDEGGDVVRAVANQLTSTRRSIPVAVLAPEAISREWAHNTGVSPIFAAAMSEDTVFPAMKAVVREILGNLRKESEGVSGGRAPPSEGRSKPWWKFW